MKVGRGMWNNRIAFIAIGAVIGMGVAFGAVYNFQTQEVAQIPALMMKFQFLKDLLKIEVHWYHYTMKNITILVSILRHCQVRTKLNSTTFLLNI